MPEVIKVQLTEKQLRQMAQSALDDLHVAIADGNIVRAQRHALRCYRYLADIEDLRALELEPQK